MRPRRLINFCDIDGGSRESTPVTLRADEWPVMMGHELCFKAYVDLSANTAGKNDGPATRSTRNGRVCYGTPLAGSVAIMLTLELRDLRAHARLPGSVSTYSFQRVGLTANAVPVVALTHPSAVSLHGNGSTKMTPDASVTWTCMAMSKGAVSAGFQYRSTVLGITYARLFALLMLPRDRAPVRPVDQAGAVFSFHPLLLSIRKMSHLSARASRRVFLAVELAWDASLTASLAYFRYSSCFTMGEFPCGSQSRNADRPPPVPVSACAKWGARRERCHRSGVFAARRSADAPIPLRGVEHIKQAWR